MKLPSNTLVKVYAAAILVIIPLVAAAWLPSDFPMLLRQLLLCAWGVGATLAAERLLFSRTWQQAWQAVGFVPARLPAVVVALLASLPMWLFLPLLAWLKDTPIYLQHDWPALLLGVVLVNGMTEEVLHRGFVFGHLRQEHSFVRAAALSALLFAAQHLYLIFSLGWISGLASVLLAALLTFPLAYSYAHGGNSLGGPAILHTSSNAPMLILAIPQSFVASVLVPYMGVVLVSIYLVFVLYRFPAGPAVKRMMLK
ncbi:MAG: CPBP family glutamic-type intramembrane protease [Anaerolineae bacterium]|nr:CPBP family glutamic-type intramembrane protease [Anaerolineae bacterium]